MELIKLPCFRYLVINLCCSSYASREHQNRQRLWQVFISNLCWQFFTYLNIKICPIKIYQVNLLLDLRRTAWYFFLFNFYIYSGKSKCMAVTINVGIFFIYLLKKVIDLSRLCVCLFYFILYHNVVFQQCPARTRSQVLEKPLRALQVSFNCAMHFYLPPNLCLIFWIRKKEGRS